MEQNYQKALQLFLNSNEEDYYRAQYQLGKIYEKGLGVETDLKQAATWYKKAAEHGHHKAQYRIGKFYTQGKGVGKNGIKAYAWLYAAAVGNIAEANELMEKIRDRLKPEKLTRAESLGKEYALIIKNTFFSDDQ